MVLLRNLFISIFCLSLISCSTFENQVTINSRSVIYYNEGILYIRGQLKTETINYFVKMPRQWKRDIHTVNIASPGGSVYIAIKIAQFIRDRKIQTIIPKNQNCYSACTLIFQSGIKRTAHKSTEFMYHYATIGTSSHSKVKRISILGTVIFFSALKQYGIDPIFIKSIKRNKMIFIKADETVKYNIVNDLLD